MNYENQNFKPFLFLILWQRLAEYQKIVNRLIDGTYAPSTLLSLSFDASSRATNETQSMRRCTFCVLPGSVGEPRDPLGGVDVLVVVLLLVVSRRPPPVQGLRFEDIPSGIRLLMILIMIRARIRLDSYTDG